jgi:tetratricopeptide (TPR) repeat protein
MNAMLLDQLWSRYNRREYQDVVGSLRGKEKITESELVLRGQAFFQLGDDREAILDFGEALKRNPMNLVARSWRGLAHARRGNHAAAAADLGEKPFFFHSEFLFEFHRHFWPLRFQEPALREVLPTTGETPKDPYDAEYQRVGENPGARKRLAAKYFAVARKYYMENRAHPLFVTACERSAELDPTQQYASMMQMLGLMMRGNYAEAEELMGGMVSERLEVYRTSKNRDDLPDREDLANWGMILHELEDFEGSLAIFADVVPGGPDDSFAHYFAALNWMMLGDLEKSRLNFQVMIERYMFDTWGVFIVPFKDQVVHWLKSKG